MGKEHSSSALLDVQSGDKKPLHPMIKKLLGEKMGDIAERRKMEPCQEANWKLCCFHNKKTEEDGFAIVLTKKGFKKAMEAETNAPLDGMPLKYQNDEVYGSDEL